MILLKSLDIKLKKQNENKLQMEMLPAKLHFEGLKMPNKLHLWGDLPPIPLTTSSG